MIASGVGQEGERKRSVDGFGGWRIDPAPLLRANPADDTERWGVKGPRVTFVEQLGAWLIAYTAVGPARPCIALAVTHDFHTAERVGVVMPPEDKDAAMLSRAVDGRFVLFHRPSSPWSGRADIWLSRSHDLRAWTSPEPVLAARPGVWWDSARVGMGPPPVETPHGWLGFYPGSTEWSTARSTGSAWYCLIVTTRRRCSLRARSSLLALSTSSALPRSPWLMSATSWVHRRPGWS